MDKGSIVVHVGKRRKLHGIFSLSVTMLRVFGDRGSTSL